MVKFHFIRISDKMLYALLVIYRKVQFRYGQIFKNIPFVFFTHTLSELTVHFSSERAIFTTVINTPSIPMSSISEQIEILHQNESDTSVDSA